MAAVRKRVPQRVIDTDIDVDNDSIDKFDNDNGNDNDYCAVNADINRPWTTADNARFDATVVPVFIIGLPRGGSTLCGTYRKQFGKRCHFIPLFYVLMQLLFPSFKSAYHAADRHYVVRNASKRR
jgi:hypothetical protein